MQDRLYGPVCWESPPWAHDLPHDLCLIVIRLPAAVRTAADLSAHFRALADAVQHDRRLARALEVSVRALEHGAIATRLELEVASSSGRHEASALRGVAEALRRMDTGSA